MTVGDRSDAMADRLARTARAAGLNPAAGEAIVEAFRTALAIRDLADPHHHAWLHPARNALILLDDIGVRDAVELCAAIHFDSTRPPLLENLAPEVRNLVSAVPRASGEDDRLLEELVVAQPAPRRIALADRLDHARHLHLGDAERWTAFHTETRAVWLPIAERTHPVFARRFRWWTDMFERRWLPGVRP